MKSKCLITTISPYFAKSNNEENTIETDNNLAIILYSEYRVIFNLIQSIIDLMMTKKMLLMKHRVWQKEWH